VQAVTADASTGRQWQWITSPPADLLNAFAWLPVFQGLSIQPDDALRDAAGVILLLSLVHQALTPLLLASDATTSRRHPVVYGAGTPAVLVGSWLLVTYAGLGLVALVAAGWNVVHKYFFALDATLGRRFAASGSVAHSLIVRVGGRRRLLVAAAVGGAVTILALRAGLPERAYLLAYMTIGGSHFLFDGFMWRTTAPVRSSDRSALNR
jgi:hypothetical protein